MWSRCRSCARRAGTSWTSACCGRAPTCRGRCGPGSTGCSPLSSWSSAVQCCSAFWLPIRAPGYTTAETVEPPRSRGFHRRGRGSAQRPLLVGSARAGPDLQPGTVGGRHTRRVQALARVGVDELRTADAPRLGGGAVAVVELNLGAVGGTGGADVHALAQRLERATRVGPRLRVGAVAGVQLDRRAVGAAGTRHVDAFAAVPVDG